MRRRAFAKSAGFDRFMPFGLFVGQVQGLIFFVFALVLMVVSIVRPALFDQERQMVQLSLAPTLAMLSTPFVTLSQGLDYLMSLSRLQAEAAKLREDNKRLEDWYSTAQLLQAENTSLRELLKVKLDPSLTFVTTRVIGDTGGPYARTIIIGAGEVDGVHKGDAVLGGEGLIGRVMSATENASVVLLITDVNSRIPVRVEGSNVQAIVAGTNAQSLTLERLPEGSTLNDGWRVLTSGVGGVFPPDLPIGTVQNNDRGMIMIKPYADFGRLLFVRVVRIPSLPADVKVAP
jgi:rod shape-determining protein MreC